MIASISVHREELRYFWANALGISGPQWMILMALAEIDQDDGVPVRVAVPFARLVKVRPAGSAPFLVMFAV